MFYQVASGNVDFYKLEIGAGSGICRDTNEILSQGTDSIIIHWTFERNPIGSIRKHAANFDECVNGLNLLDWENLIRISGVNYIRTTLCIESGDPCSFLKIRYKLDDGKLYLKFNRVI